MNNEDHNNEGTLRDLSEAIDNLIKRHTSDEAQREETLKFLVRSREDLSELTGKIKMQTDHLQTITEHFPEELKVNIRHRFEGRTRILTVVFIVALMITSLMTGLWYSLWGEGKRLEANDLKYRYHGLTQPEMVFQTDTLYANDPNAFEKMIRQLEAEQTALQRAASIVRQKELEAQEAKLELENLKKNR